MRHGPFLAVLLAVLSAIPIVGCSRKAERLVGSARLIRGPGGLGTTVRFIRNPDRDTYVEPGTANFGGVLIIGSDTTFDARTFLAVASWKLPDTTLAGFSPVTVSLELKRDTTLLDPGTVSLFLAASAWDTTTVAWPGPLHPTFLGSAHDDRPAAGYFSIPLVPGAFDLVKQWAHDPTAAPGFALQRTGDSLLAYVPGAAVFRVRYTHVVSGNAVLDSVDTPVTQDFYLHSPISPAPTGADTSVMLGGLFDTALAVHLQLDSIPAAVSIDEATLVLNIVGVEVPDAGDVASIVQVRRIRNVWSESITEKSTLTIDDATAASVLLSSTYASAGKRLTIVIPGALLREWAATSSSNEGLYVSLIHPVNRIKKFQIGSRESSRPPEIHVTYTGLPPVRF
ncbi:MAG: hypothetical protein E6K77_02770 [Candidatus Eisenbacteria bacterium]|uniref:DNRLRE domain-containing protein n=1 Tax=Eiseniibacteriota bacterium TaxID=2212470 RepID=A0A538SXX3_UNCEI|nr:MAG: hypothetical protein E6K74_00760 [Candidatus Eisenbacteria bacterium]TMQ65501.1 MAG: hypothetical protein E6K77_02770 [Candidatus Eisenbacteria bacterium]